MFWKTLKEKMTKLTAFASITVFIIVAFEIMIMISPTYGCNNQQYTDYSGIVSLHHF
ncbi:MAG TPA: hypothetical protein VFG29_06095 [Syntrophales bacterium]|nr:hypothetical protein [Syntrophales bacterium]